MNQVFDNLIGKNEIEPFIKVKFENVSMDKPDISMFMAGRRIIEK